MRLTEITINALKAPKKGAQIYYDDTLSGFGVRVSQAGTKSYILTYGPRRRRETIGRVGIISLHEARQTAKKRLAEYTLGRDRPEAVTWRVALEEYLADRASSLKESTHLEYDRVLKKHFRFGDTRLTEIAPRDLQKDLDRLAGAEKFHAFTTVRAFVNWAHRRHYFDRNPMERMIPPQGSRPRERILSKDELSRVWQNLGTNTFGSLVKVLILTGQRVGEVSRLRPSMVGRDLITFPGALTKNGRDHKFPIAEFTHSILQDRITDTEAYVFPARTSITRPFSGYSKCKATLETVSGTSDWTLHDLRRTFASGLAALAVPIPVIERLLNHISGSFAGIVGVYQRYDYLPEMRDAMVSWEKHVLSITRRV